jgi:phage shock protein C
MDKTITISLTGHAGGYRLAEAAYDRLATYLDEAAARLPDDADRSEVLGDLERSIGDKLAVLLASGDRLITATDIGGVLDEIGAVDTGHEPARSDDDDARPRPRRLQRIREGQMIAGVCNGLAVYSDLRVDWVRTIFVFATIFTAGGFALVYLAMAFILPVAAPDSAYRMRR